MTWIPGRINPRGLIHTVAVLVDQNAAGKGDTFGDAGPSYVAVGGLEAVPCRVVQLDARAVEAAGKLRDTAHFTILFGSPIVLDGTNKLIWQEPNDSLLWHLLCEGQSRNEQGMGHHWSVDAMAYKQV